MLFYTLHKNALKVAYYSKICYYYSKLSVANVNSTSQVCAFAILLLNVGHRNYVIGGVLRRQSIQDYI